MAKVIGNTGPLVCVDTAGDRALWFKVECFVFLLLWLASFTVE